MGVQSPMQCPPPLDNTYYLPSLAVKPELKDLIIELIAKTSDKWENVGILLGIEPGRLDAIKAVENQTVEECEAKCNGESYVSVSHAKIKLLGPIRIQLVAYLTDNYLHACSI